MDTDSEEIELGGIWPRFLVIEGSDMDYPLKKLLPFAIATGIKGIVWEVAKKVHVDSLIETTRIAHVPVKVTAHRSLITRTAGNSCRELTAIKHIMIYCVDFDPIRTDHCNVDSM